MILSRSQSYLEQQQQQRQASENQVEGGAESRHVTSRHIHIAHIVT